MILEPGPRFYVECYTNSVRLASLGVFYLLILTNPDLFFMNYIIRGGCAHLKANNLLKA
jgi:hypothetical protein